MAATKSLPYKSLAKKIGNKRVQIALPYIFGGIAFGTSVWLVAKNWNKITEFAKKLYPMNDVTDESKGHTDSIEGKPYPVESTSKKHSKSHVMFKDVQKITNV